VHGHVEAATEAEADAASIADPSTGWSRPASLALSLLALLYTAAVHHGLGAPPGGMATSWWHPTGFLRDWEGIGLLADAPLVGIALLTAPAAALLALLYLRPAPALARTAVAAATASVAILSFYGLYPSAYSVWSFFHWRGSVVMLASGSLLGATLTSPDLARALRRQPLLVQTMLYGAVFFGVSSLIRNATGWDARLAFNISPWPAIPVLALEIGAAAWVGLLAGLAIALASVAFARRAAGRVAGLAAGCLFPAVWFGLRFPHTETRLLVVGVLLSTGMVAVAVYAGTGRRAMLAERAAALGLAAALVALPLVSGRALADGDFTVSKHVRARVINDALARYYDEEGVYPESLEELVGAGLLDAIPAPRVGSGLWQSVGLTDPQAFDYRNLGSSYVLEFVATEWVMCSYNPPWEDDFDDDDGDLEVDVVDLEAALAECLEVCHASCRAETGDCDAYCGDACESERAEQAAVAAAEAGDAGGEAWSCPDARPELW